MQRPTRDEQAEALVEKQGRNSLRLSMLLKVGVVWVLTNLLVWWAPSLRESVEVFLAKRELDKIAAHYNRRSVQFADTHGHAASLGYLLYKPATRRERRLPLLVFLHGSGARGDDLRSHLHEIGLELVRSSWQTKHPCYIAAPQCPAGSTWRSRSPVDMQLAIKKMLDEIERNHMVDQRRIYLAGWSMGAYGCWSLGAHAPDRFAAILPVAGGGDTRLADQLASLPIWAVHGEDDSVVPLEASQAMVTAVKQAGGDARLTKLQGIGHDSWAYVRTGGTMHLEWLFAQTRDGRREVQRGSVTVHEPD